jgi:hypothetical protein
VDEIVDLDSLNDMDADDIESESLFLPSVSADVNDILDDADDAEKSEDEEEDPMEAFYHDSADTEAASSALDAVLGLDDDDDAASEDEVIVNGVVLNQFQIPSPGVSPMQVRGS